MKGATWRSSHVHATENPFHRFAWRHRRASTLFYRAKFYISTLSRFNSGDYEARRFNTAHYGIVLLIDVVVELFIVSSFSRCEPCLLKPLIISYVIFIYCKASTNPTCIFYDNSTRKWLTNKQFSFLLVVTVKAYQRMNHHRIGSVISVCLTRAANKCIRHNVWARWRLHMLNFKSRNSSEFALSMAGRACFIRGT